MATRGRPTEKDGSCKWGWVQGRSQADLRTLHGLLPALSAPSSHAPLPVLGRRRRPLLASREAAVSCCVTLAWRRVTATVVLHLHQLLRGLTARGCWLRTPAVGPQQRQQHVQGFLATSGGDSFERGESEVLAAGSRRRPAWRRLEGAAWRQRDTRCTSSTIVRNGTALCGPAVGWRGSSHGMSLARANGFARQRCSARRRYACVRVGVGVGSDGCGDGCGSLYCSLSLLFSLSLLSRSLSLSLPFSLY